MLESWRHGRGTTDGVSGLEEGPARTSAEALFEAFPEWRAFARREVGERGSEYIVVKVEPPPEADVECGLRIDTANDEITVEFDFYHQHFDDWAGESSPFGTESALEFVRQILEQRVAIVSWWRDDECVASSTTNVGVPPEQPTWLGAYDRLRVRSWRGTFNVDSDA